MILAYGGELPIVGRISYVPGPGALGTLRDILVLLPKRQLGPESMLGFEYVPGPGEYSKSLLTTDMCFSLFPTTHAGDFSDVKAIFGS